MDGKKLEYKGEDALKEIEKLTAEAAEVQDGILKEIIKQNVETEYLNKYMKGSKDVSEFKRCVPVITYKNIYPYIQRIANGEGSSLITGQPITEMLCRFPLSHCLHSLHHYCLFLNFNFWKCFLSYVES